MKSPDQKKELYVLLHALCEDQITDQQFTRLDEILYASREACEIYVDFRNLWSDLRYFQASLQSHGQEVIEGTDILTDSSVWEALSLAQQESPAIELPTEKPERELIQKVVYPPREKRRLSKFNIVSLVMSAAAILMFVSLLMFPQPENGVVGQLTRVVNANWDSVSGPIDTGSDLYSGPLKLTTGFAEIKFGDGATALLEAPVELVLESPRQMYVNSGKVVVRIDKHSDQTFVLRSSSGMIVDYGTEFGVSVTDGVIETYVFEGQVALRDGNDPVKFANEIILKASESGKVIPGKKPKRADIDGYQFVQSEEFDIRYQAEQGSSYARWKEYQLQIRKDPSIVAYYTFEQEDADKGVLLNKALSTKGRLNGELMSKEPSGAKPKWVEGRWPQKRSLNFDANEKQIVHVDADPSLAINGAITLGAWVRLSENRKTHILSCRDNEESNFQLGFNNIDALGNGQVSVQFLRKKKVEPVYKGYSSPVYGFSSGWVFLAATHDNTTIRYYLNGQLSDVVEYEFIIEPILADLVIGTDQTFNDLNLFHGQIGEIMIFNRVLSNHEIEQMYKVGVPQ